MSRRAEDQGQWDFKRTPEKIQSAPRPVTPPDISCLQAVPGAIVSTKRAGFFQKQKKVTELKYEEILETCFPRSEISAKAYGEGSIFTEIEFEALLKSRLWDRKPWLSAVNREIKRALKPYLEQLLSAREETNSLKDAYTSELKNMHRKPPSRCASQERCEGGKPPFLLGKSGKQDSKHSFTSKRSVSPLPTQKQDHWGGSEFKVSLLEDLHEKKLQFMVMRGLECSTHIAANRRTLLDEGVSKTNAILLHYLVAAWVNYARIRREKNEVKEYSERLVSENLRKRVFDAWKQFPISKQNKKEEFKITVEILTGIRIKRLYYNWVMYCFIRTEKRCKRDLADMGYENNLKAKILKGWTNKRNYSRKHIAEIKNIKVQWLQAKNQVLSIRDYIRTPDFYKEIPHLTAEITEKKSAETSLNRYDFPFSRESPVLNAHISYNEYQNRGATPETTANPLRIMLFENRKIETPEVLPSDIILGIIPGINPRDLCIYINCLKKYYSRLKSIGSSYHFIKGENLVKESSIKEASMQIYYYKLLSSYMCNWKKKYTQKWMSKCYETLRVSKSGLRSLRYVHKKSESTRTMMELSDQFFYETTVKKVFREWRTVKARQENIVKRTRLSKVFNKWVHYLHNKAEGLNNQIKAHTLYQRTLQTKAMKMLYIFLILKSKQSAFRTRILKRSSLHQ